MIAQTEMLCESAVEEAGLSLSEVSSILLAGGSTRIPIVRDSIYRTFGMEPTSSGNVDEVVALGAALYAAYKGDQANLSSAQRTSVSQMRLSEATSKCFGTIILEQDGERRQERLKNTILIHKNETIPCSVTDSFYTVHDGQTSVKCTITDSTSPETDPQFVNKLWEGTLDLPEGRRSGQEIRVTYSFDENQIMHCSFVDVATGRKTEIDLSLSDGKGRSASDIDKFLVE